MCGKVYHKTCALEKLVLISNQTETHRICDTCWNVIVEKDAKLFNMPDEAEVNAQFEIFLEEQCAKPAQAAIMRNFDSNKKWVLLCSQTVSFS